MHTAVTKERYNVRAYIPRVQLHMYTWIQFKSNYFANCITAKG